MKTTFARTIGIFVLSLNFGCEKDAPKGCIDKSKTTSGICPAIYAPVCGCDNKTYSNSCEAEGAGLTSYSNGECK